MTGPGLHVKTISTHVIFCFAFALIPGKAQPEILFEDNFNDHSDWTSPEQQLSAGSDVSYGGGSATTACGVCPDGRAKYAGFFNQRSAWPDYRGEPLAKINSMNARGGAGKALTFWHEPIDSVSCDGGTYWCSGGEIVALLTEPHDEIYISVYIKFDPNWVLDQDAQAIQKMLRASHFYDPPGNLFAYFYGPNASHHPIAGWNTYYGLGAQGGNRMWDMFSQRYTAAYYPYNATPAQAESDMIATTGGTGYLGGKLWTEYLGDSQWHHLQMHLKGNTAGGYYPGNPNGEFEFWIDEQLVHSRKDMAWADGAFVNWSPTPFPGWNYVGLGGNAYNRVYPVTDHTEQWYAMDDFVVSTTYVSPDYIIGGDTTPPAVPGGLILN